MYPSLPKTPEDYRKWWSENTEQPYGLCWCGCGQKTKVQTKPRPNFGEVAYIKGTPLRYIRGHRHRVLQHSLEEDRGYKTPCWVWQLKIADNGYGHATVGGRSKLAHRHIYEKHNGPIPVGLSLDHLCRVRACVNPAHLEAVPMYVNQRRGGKTVLSVELVDALKVARSQGVEFPVLETLTGIKKRTIIAAVYGENWSKGA